MVIRQSKQHGRATLGLWQPQTCNSILLILLPFNVHNIDIFLTIFITTNHKHDKQAIGQINKSLHKYTKINVAKVA